MTADLYARLGVGPQASEAEIKQAYRRLARNLHPDLHPEDAEAEDRFKALTEAYETLRDTDRRRAYDRRRTAPRPPSSPPQPGPPVRPKGERGRDLRVSLPLTLSELAQGTRATVGVERLERCDACGGTGARPDSVPVVCQTCGGKGASGGGSGWFSMPRPCPDCRGQGRRFAHACSACGGQGRRSRRRRIEVQVPAGVASGTRLRVRGEGEGGSGTAGSGDLYVVVEQKAHALLERDGSDLRVEVPLTLCDAVLGADVEVPTLDGTTTVRVPPGTTGGTETVLRGLGLPRSSGRGDLRVRWTVALPAHLSTEQRSLLEQLREIERRSTLPQSVQRYRDRLRELGPAEPGSGN